ncbi:3-beta-hydroxysteroid sulfotransferase-like [Sarcophilus harrisii]
MQDEFEVQDKDVIVATYPKSGTHWMIDILSLIYSKGDPTWIKSVPAWKRSPWLEFKNNNEIFKNKKDAGLLASHLPVHLFPKSCFTSKAKVSTFPFPVPYGSWFDHIKGWLSMRNSENFLLITYEELYQVGSLFPFIFHVFKGPY